MRNGWGALGVLNFCGSPSTVKFSGHGARQRGANAAGAVGCGLRVEREGGDALRTGHGWAWASEGCRVCVPKLCLARTRTHAHAPVRQPAAAAAHIEHLCRHTPAAVVLNTLDLGLRAALAGVLFKCLYV